MVIRVQKKLTQSVKLRKDALVTRVETTSGDVVP